MRPAPTVPSPPVTSMRSRLDALIGDRSVPCLSPQPDLAKPMVQLAASIDLCLGNFELIRMWNKLELVAKGLQINFNMIWSREQRERLNRESQFTTFTRLDRRRSGKVSEVQAR